MKAIGVCGSDIHVYHGKHPYMSYPVVQGHEVSAVVEEPGAGVTNVAVGDLVTVQPQVVCGTCYPCTHGMYNDCESLKVMGFQTTGMASDYFVVDAAKALRLASAGLIEFESLITHRIPFDRYLDAYKLIEEQKDRAMKVMIEME